MTNKSMGSFLSELRKEKGITQKELADYLNVSDKTVSHWECDNYSPDISVIPVLAEFFGVTCDELLKGEKKQPEYKENSFSYEPLTKESEYRKFALKSLENAYGKLKITNVVAIFAGALMWAVLFVVIQLIDRYVPIWDFKIYANSGSAVFSAGLGAIISLSAYQKFKSKLNMCDLSQREHALWKRKALRVFILPIILFVTVLLLVIFMLMPSGTTQMQTATETFPVSHYGEELPQPVDPSEAFSYPTTVSPSAVN